MTNDNKKINKLVSEQDDDPTAELEILSVAALAGGESTQDIESESDAHTFDFDKIKNEIGNDDETIANLKSDLKSRAENISKLQFDIEQLRSRWSGLETEIRVREEISKNLTNDLKATQKKQSKTSKLLNKRDKEIASLQAKLSDREQSLQDFRDRDQESRTHTAEIQSELDMAAERLTALAAETELERSEKRESREQARSLTKEIDALRRDLSASTASVSELREDLDCRTLDCQRQEAQILDYQSKLEELKHDLSNSSEKLKDEGAVAESLNAKLRELEGERDDLLKEIAEFRKTTQSRITDITVANKQMLAEQKELLAAKSFEISELTNQISRTESYADELRKQLQDQLLLTDELQTRQKHLEITLAGADTQIQELSASIEDLRSGNQYLLEEKSVLEGEHEKEVRQIRFELGQAQETIADRDSSNQRLTSDLTNTREFKMNLESDLKLSEDKNREAIANLKQKLAQLESRNEELNYKLTTKDNAISALLNELAKRSKAIESIGELGDVIHELDDRMSEQIDDRAGAERDRITRLLVGKIGGQKLRFPLFKNRLTIGRTGHNDIQLKAPHISRRHAVIVSDANSTRIVDWGSKNGVFVNTEQIKEKTLRNGDIVTIGTADFKFEERPKR